MRNLLLGSASAFALATMTFGTALAQDNRAENSGATTESTSTDRPARSGGSRTVVPADEIIVTASRAAAVSGFNAPTPTTVISAETLERQGAQNIGDILQQVPSYSARSRPEANAFRINAPGTQQANLRALGAQRTLVLVNGRRLAPFAPSVYLGADSAAAPNLNTVPPLMIERTEIVTGGASAQWGSDAVGGVINIILRDSFEGVKFTASAGASQENDYKNTRYGFVAGTNFSDDRGNIIIGADYADNKGIGDIYSRDWGAEEWMVYTPTAADKANGASASLLVVPNVHTGLSRDGLIRQASGQPAFSLVGYDFASDGQSVQPFQFGEFHNTFWMVGGEGKTNAENINLVPPYERSTIYAQVRYDITDSVTAKLEGSFSNNLGVITGGINRRASLVIHQDNPFLPAAIAQTMVDEGVENFLLSRIFVDIGNVKTQVDTDLARFAAGLEGEFANGWKWDAYYQYGINKTDFQIGNSTNLPAYRFAIDAVDDGSGNIVCRETLAANPAARSVGCVPLNPFGENNFSQAAKDYVTTIPMSQSEYTQQVAAANLVGQPFSLWAGPVSMAVGVEYRKEEQDITANDVSIAGLALFGNTKPWSGDYDVKEAYIDTIIPLANPGNLVKSLEFSAAARIAEYSTAGQQTAWKVGLTYAPVDELSFRYVMSQDIRAPQIYELFSPGSPTQLETSVLGQTVQITANTAAGSSTLDAETAKSYSVGAVFQPSGLLEGFRFSVDYYDIDISDAILQFNVTNVASLCNAGDQKFCDLFTYDSGGVPIALNSGFINAASYNNVGIDYAASYRTELADWFGGAVPGTISSEFAMTDYLHSYIDAGTGAGKTDRAGENGEANFGAVPDYQFNWSTTYSVGPTSITAQMLYISSGKLDNAYNTTVNNTINNNDVKSATVFNLYGTLDVSENVSLFGSVANVLDQRPPISPNVGLQVPVNGTLYDKVGRAFRGGINVAF